MADIFTPNTVNAAGQFAWSNLANWSTGAMPDQNTAATLNSTAAGYTLLVGGVYAASQVTFGSGAGSLNLTIATGDSLTSGTSALVAAGSTVTIAAGSTGTFATNGLEVQTGATFNVNGGTFNSPSSGLTLDNGAVATFGAGVTLNVNTLNLNGSAKLTLDVGTAGAPHVISNVNDFSGTSTLSVSGGDLQLGSGGGGTYAVSNGGVIEFTGSLGSNATLDLNGGSILLDNNTSLQSGTSFAFSAKPSTVDVVSANNYQNGFGYAVTGFDYSDKLQFGNLNLTGDVVVYTSLTHTLLILSIGGATLLTLTNLSLASDATNASFKVSGNTIQLACFLSGTLVETADGAVPVESLRAGQQVITIEHGERVPRPLRWVGSRSIDAADIPGDEDAYPVRIRAGAFAPGLPLRDLLVTGEHGIHVGGGLIPVRMLVNGRSILRDTAIARYTVHHVEFDTHAIMLAEGLPVESYLDTGNRASFDGAGYRAPGRTWSRRARRSWRGDAAAPLTVGREAVEPVWRALDRRADLLGLAPLPDLPLSGDPDLGVLLADGQVLPPRWHSGERHLFHLPDGAQPVRLLSRSARPSEVIGPFVDDRRRLGVGVSRITLWNGLTDTVLQASELSGVGWHRLEDGQRWTDGEATLSMPAATGADTFLEVQLGARTQYRTGPAPIGRLAA